MMMMMINHNNKSKEKESDEERERVGRIVLSRRQQQYVRDRGLVHCCKQIIKMKRSRSEGENEEAERDEESLLTSADPCMPRDKRRLQGEKNEQEWKWDEVHEMEGKEEKDPLPPNPYRCSWERSAERLRWATPLPSWDRQHTLLLASASNYSFIASLLFFITIWYRWSWESTAERLRWVNPVPSWREPIDNCKAVQDESKADKSEEKEEEETNEVEEEEEVEEREKVDEEEAKEEEDERAREEERNDEGAEDEDEKEDVEEPKDEEEAEEEEAQEESAVKSLPLTCDECCSNCCCCCFCNFLLIFICCVRRILTCCCCWWSWVCVRCSACRETSRASSNTLRAVRKLCDLMIQWRDDNRDGNEQ